MRKGQFKSIFRFEFLNMVTNKIYLVLTILLVVGVGVLLSFPRITGWFSDGGADGPPAETEKPVIAVSATQSADAQTMCDYLTAAVPAREFVPAQQSADALQGAIREGRYSAAVVLRDALNYDYVVGDLRMDDMTTMQIDQALVAKYRADTLTGYGLSAEEITKVESAQATAQVIQTGKNQMESFGYTYVLIMALYMSIVMYGQLVAVNVAAEKSSRAMELLITSAKPTSLMFGKVLGSGSAGLLQMVMIFGSGYLFFNLNRGFWAENPIVSSIFDMPLSILLYTLLFFVLGFFIYAFLYGALGSLASRSEDVNTLSMPLTMVLILALMVIMTSLFGDMNGPLMVFCSYFPLTSPMAMFTRIAMGNVPAYEIILSVAILVGSVIAIGFLAAAIYKIGVLLYGKPPKIGELVRILKNRRARKNG